MAEPALADKVVAIERTLRRHRIPHAFGGALAFAYYGEPRATVDIDLNLFTEVDRYPRLIDVLGPLGVAPARDPAVVQRDGQVRVWWGRTPLDLFVSYDPIHAAMRERSRPVPFAASTIPILGPEHLIVAKVVCTRAKDWIDIAQMLIAVPALDVSEIRRWAERLFGATGP